MKRDKFTQPEHKTFDLTKEKPSPIMSRIDERIEELTNLESRQSGNCQTTTGALDELINLKKWIKKNV